MTFHISHNDLDGFSCQAITKKAITDIIFYNCNYGKELELAVEKVLKQIKANDNLLITDLNLSEQLADKLAAEKENIGFNLELIDHHISGKVSAEKHYSWYHLNSNFSATMLTYNRFKNLIKEKDISLEKELEFLANAVNAYDMWQEDNEFINSGKALNSIITEKHKFPEILNDLSRDYITDMLLDLSSSLNAEFNQPMHYSEGNKYYSERYWFESKLEVTNPKEALETVRVRYMAKYVQEKGLRKIIEINGLKGEVHYGLSAIFQEFASIRNNSGEIDFCVNINSKGFMSFRSKGDKNVEEIARKYFSGGGHFNAAGGSLLDEGANKVLTFEEAWEIFALKVFA